MTPSNDALVHALRGALPWLRLHRGKTFVVKLGGAALDGDADVRGTAEQLSVLAAVGIKVVVVHGGGDQISRTQEAMGVEVRKIGGRRVTCEGTLDVATMVLNGSVRTRLLAAFRELGTPATGISGVDAGTIRANRRPPTQGEDGEMIDWGHVGDIDAVDPSLVSHLLSQGQIVLVSPLCADDQGNVLNVNADSVAAELSVALGASKLLLVTDAPGILADPRDPDSLVVVTDLAGLDALEAEGALEGGMKPKVACIRRAIGAGVERVHVLGHRTADAIIRECFTNEGAGTLITEDA